MFETSLTPRATASKQTIKNIVMMTVEFSLDNPMDLSGKQLLINFKRLIGLELTMKFKYPKGLTGRFPICPIIVS